VHFSRFFLFKNHAYCLIIAINIYLVTFLPYQ
jgi:hypothetical protein